jgi:hypothetical protein
MKQSSVFEQLQKGIGDAVADIREKVVEEGYFGRAVTDRGQGLDWPEPQGQEQPGFGSHVSHYEKGARWPEAKEAGTHEQTQQTKEPGIER